MQSRANIKTQAVPQVALVVNDVQRTAEAFWNLLGIGPWELFPLNLRANYTYRGSGGWAAGRVAIAQVGAIELELLQHVEGKTIYKDWVNEQGEGIQHLKFVVEDRDVQRLDRAMEELGFPVIQSGRAGPQLQYHHAYYDARKALRCILETSNSQSLSARGRFGGLPFPSEPNAVSPARVKIAGMKRIGIAVKNAVRTAENYWNILGIGPWEIREEHSCGLLDRVYHGEPAWGREIVATASVLSAEGDMELELCQPLEGDSIYRDWIDAKGEGLHHLQLLCEDVDKTSALLAEQGFLSIQSGHFGDAAAGRGGYSFIDVEPLHCIIQLRQDLASRAIGIIGRVPVTG